MTTLLSVEAVADAPITDLYDTLHVLRAELTKRDEQTILDVLKALVAKEPQLTGAVRFVFGTSSWENGYFYDDGWVRVEFPDRVVNSYDLDNEGEVPADLHDALTELADDYGPLTGSSQLKVDVELNVVTSY